MSRPTLRRDDGSSESAPSPPSAFSLVPPPRAAGFTATPRADGRSRASQPLLQPLAEGRHAFGNAARVVREAVADGIRRAPQLPAVLRQHVAAGLSASVRSTSGAAGSHSGTDELDRPQGFAMPFGFTGPRQGAGAGGFVLPSRGH
jgi:hypothetical protein